MPLYEYACTDCGLVFEKVLPVRFAQTEQPCPECDADARRNFATNFNPYIFRDGASRRLPDNGKFRHYGVEVSRPINTTVQQGEHPDLIRKKRGPEPLPTTEEVERFESLRKASQAKQKERTGRGIKINAVEMEEMSRLDRRIKSTAERSRLAKRRPTNEETTPRTRSGEHARRSDDGQQA